METLDNLRNRIDTIDDQLIELLDERMRLALQTIEHKKTQQRTVLDPEREHRIVQRLHASDTQALSPSGLTRIFKSIMHESKLGQQRILAPEQEKKVAIMGEAGSYTECAAIQYFDLSASEKQCISYAMTGEQVLDHLTQRRAAYGVLALSNSSMGIVAETIDALGIASTRVLDTFLLPVHHALLVLPGTALSDIQAVYSHEQALRQCECYMATHIPHAAHRPVVDTGWAAQTLSKNELPKGSAVIAHPHCATLYGLTRLATSINDKIDNATLFIVIELVSK